MSTLKLLPGIIASKKGPEFGFCKYCSVDFGIGHGGFNDITRHVKTKSHGNHGRVVGGNRSLLSFAAATNDSLSTKVLTAEISFTNFIAQHNLPFLANYIREDRKLYSVLHRPSRRPGIIIPLFYTHTNFSNCGQGDPSNFSCNFYSISTISDILKKSIENLQNQEEIRKTMNSSTNGERNHLATLVSIILHLLLYIVASGLYCIRSIKESSRTPCCTTP